MFFDPETAKEWVEKVDEADVDQWMKQAMESFKHFPLIAFFSW